MKLVLKAGDLEIDAWLEDYLRTTVVFATWWVRRPAVEAVEILLDRVGGGAGSPYVRCALRAERPGRAAVASGATGANVCEAVREASNLLEAALSRPLPPVVRATPVRSAARNSLAA
ncbi:MAG: hypothetical protein MJE66_07925 [Proteobacteria bacterium]|nr:hypothetical protein [Pseudomonadota bacterium]